MACAYKCDRCGKFFESHYTTTVELTTSNNINKSVKFDCGPYPDLDLCPDCVESFKHWWANETVIPITKKRGKKEIKENKDE